MSDIPFRRVCSLIDVPDREGTTVELDGNEIAVFRDGETIWATEGRCPHAFELMSKAVLDCQEQTVTCLAHHYCFELRSGKAVKPTPGIAWLKLYPVEVRNGEVFVRFEASEDEW